MQNYISIREQHCHNQACVFYKKTGHQNIAIHGKMPERLRCTVCKKTWVAHKNQPHFGLKSSPEKIKKALELLNVGLSVRRVARRCQASTSSIQRWKQNFKNFKHD
jgi:transposase-like protein